MAIAAADDETGQVEIKIKAPIEAVSCDPTAPTITVLGMQISIATASLDGESDGSGSSDGSAQGGTSGGTGDDGSGDTSGDGGGGSAGCAALTVGQAVEVKLASDAVPLVATEVSPEGDSEVTLQAPIQELTSATTIKVLGLSIDISQANMEGADDEDNQAQGQGTAIDPSQLMLGQIVEVQLASSQPPFVANHVDVKNFTNQVEVEVEDQNGEIDDTDANGNPVDDVDVEVDETVSVMDASTGILRKVKKVLHFHKSSHGSFTLSGVPTGHAKIQVTRAASVGKKRISVKPNTKRIVKLRLRAPR